MAIEERKIAQKWMDEIITSKKSVPPIIAMHMRLHEDDETGKLTFVDGSDFSQDEENELQRLVAKIKYKQPTYDDMESARYYLEEYREFTMSISYDYNKKISLLTKIKNKWKTKRF